MLIICGQAGIRAGWPRGNASEHHSPGPERGRQAGCQGSHRDTAGRPAKAASSPGQQPQRKLACYRQGPGVERWETGHSGPHLTFVVCGVWREADVHRPLDCTIEAVRVRAGVTEVRSWDSECSALTHTTHIHTHADIQTDRHEHTLGHTGADICTWTYRSRYRQTQDEDKHADT